MAAAADSRIVRTAALIAVVCALLACEGGDPRRRDSAAPRVPRGYAAVLRIDTAQGIVAFGPFVGYYFAPESPPDLRRLRFVCFNESSFYTRDLPAGAKLFEGEARFAVLPETDFDVPEEAARITPVFFEQAPPAWPASRPEPRDEFLHFHSCHDARGFVASGFWLRHVGVAEFTYDMGGRVSASSPLYHRVSPGPDKGFARIIEFDRGPRRDPGP